MHVSCEGLLALLEFGDLVTPRSAISTSQAAQPERELLLWSLESGSAPHFV